MDRNCWSRLFASVPKKMAKFILVHAIRYAYEDLLRFSHTRCLSYFVMVYLFCYCCHFSYYLQNSRHKLQNCCFALQNFAGCNVWPKSSLILWKVYHKLVFWVPHPQTVTFTEIFLFHDLHVKQIHAHKSLRQIKDSFQ